MERLNVTIFLCDLCSSAVGRRKRKLRNVFIVSFPLLFLHRPPPPSASYSSSHSSSFYLFFPSCTIVFPIQMFISNSSSLLFRLHILTSLSSFSPTTSSSTVLLFLLFHIIGSFPSFNLLFIHTFTYSPHTIPFISSITAFFLLHLVILPSYFHFFIVFRTFYFIFFLHSTVLLHTLTSPSCSFAFFVLSFPSTSSVFTPIFILKISR